LGVKAWWAFAAAALALALRLALLLARPLWHDERFTVWLAPQAPLAIVDALRTDSGPPLFYFLESAARAAMPGAPAEIASRAVSFLAALLLLPFARVLDPGRRATWIALVSSFALINLYAVEARAYSLLALLTFCVFLLARAGPERAGRLALLAAAGAAALYTHYLAIFAVAAAAAVALTERRWKSAAACLAAFALFAPWTPILADQPAAAMAWMREGAAETLTGWISALGGVGRIPAPFGAPLPGVLMGAAALAGLVLVASTAQAARRDREARAGLLFVALVLGAAALASFVRPLAFAGRSEMAALPVWIWAVTRVAGASRPARFAAAGAAALGLLATLLVATSPHPVDTSVAAVRSVGKLSRAGDTLLAGPGFSLAARLAADRGALSARVESLPAEDAGHPGWFVATPPGPSEESALRSAMDRVPPGSRLFVLLPPSHATAGVMAVLSSRGTVRELVRQPDAVLLAWIPEAQTIAP
jgi:hypothetical protein